MTARLRRYLGALAGRGHDLFLSHGTSDGATYAEGLNTALQAEGYDVFLDGEELRVGDSLTTELETRVRGSRVLVLVGTRGAFASGWVTEEVNSYLAAHSKAPRLIRILFDGHDVPKDHIHGETLENTLGVREPNGPLGPVSDEVVEAIKKHFEGIKIRIQRRIAALCLAAAVLGGAVFAQAEITKQRRTAQIERHMARARAREGQLDFAGAELAYAEAWEASKGTAPDAESGYWSARERRALESRGFIPASESVLIGLFETAEGPLVVTESIEGGLIRMWVGDHAEELDLSAGGTYFSALLGNGWLTLWNDIALWVQPTNSPSQGRYLKGAAGCVALEWDEADLMGLFETDDGCELRRFPINGSGPSETTKVPPPENALVMMYALVGASHVFAAGDEAWQGGGFLPTAWLRPVDGVEWTAFPMVRELNLTSQGFKAWVSDTGKLALLALSPVDFSSPGANQPERNLYTRLDDIGLAWPMDTGSIRPVLIEKGPIDVVYLTEAGDLKWQAPPPIVVTQLSPVTLASDVSSFVVLTRSEDENPDVVAVDESGTVTFLRDGAPWSRYSVAAGQVELMKSPSGRLIAADASDGIQVWELEQPDSGGAIPSVGPLSGAAERNR